MLLRCGVTVSLWDLQSGGHNCHVATTGKLIALWVQYNLVPAKEQWRCVAGKLTAGWVESNNSLLHLLLGFD